MIRSTYRHLVVNPLLFWWSFLLSHLGSSFRWIAFTLVCLKTKIVKLEVSMSSWKMVWNGKTISFCLLCSRKRKYSVGSVCVCLASVIKNSHLLINHTNKRLLVNNLCCQTLSQPNSLVDAILTDSRLVPLSCNKCGLKSNIFMGQKPEQCWLIKMNAEISLIMQT